METMTLNQAIATWNRVKAGVTAESLNDEKRHQLVHDINAVIVKALKDGVMTYDEFERRTAI